jgi:hypothetical protein
VHSARACLPAAPLETSDSLHSVEAHVAGRAHASTCTAAGDYCVRRLVSSRSRASPHRRRWTPRCSEPGYGGVGVTVHPACDPSQPSVTQSDALPGQPKILYRKLCGAAAAARVLAYCLRGKPHNRRASLCAAHLTLATTNILPSSEATSVWQRARTRDGAYRDRAQRRGQEVDMACHHEGRMPVNVSIALVRRINRPQRQ